MARSVTFNGITRFKPGGITKVNAEALNQVLLSANSVVALVGEADGGAPGTSGLVTLSDPSRATRTFRSGPLVDAIRQAFQPSNDPDVPGGASQVLVYKTNASTQSSLSLPSATATEHLSSTATGGSTTTVVDTNLSGTADDQYNGKYLVLRPFTATTEVRVITDYDSGTQTFTVATLNAAAMAADDYLIYDPEVEVMDALDVGGSSSTVLAVKDVDWADDDHNGRWVHIQDTASVDYLRQVTDTDGTAETITVSPALPATPTDGSYIQILPNVVDLLSKDWGSHTNSLTVDISAGVGAGTKVVTIGFEGAEEVSPDLGGDFVMSLLYRGGAAAVSDTVDTGATTTVIPLVTGGLSISAHVGTQVQIGDEYTEITANTATELTVSPALSEAPAATTAVSIRTLTSGTMSVQGAAGVPTGLTTTLGGVVGDDLSLTFSTGQTLRQLVTEINSNSNYLATVAPGVNPDTTLVSDFDFGLDTEASILSSAEIADEGLTQDLAAVIAYFNDFSEFVSATRSTDTGSLVAGCCSPAATLDSVQMTGGTRGTSTNSTFQAAFDKLLTVRVNSVVPLIDQDLVEEGYGSTATWASVAAQLADHVTISRGAAQNTAGERGGYVGFRGTRDEVIDAANSVNDFDIALCAQNPTVLSATGTLQEFGPRMQAVMAAGMRAGVTEVAEPLTHKLLRVSGLTQDSSWDPNDLTDSNLLIQNGVLFAETVDAGTHWVRDLTTWVADDNLAFVEGSVRDAVRFVAYELRSTLVARFTGKKAKPATIANVKEAAATVLELQRTNSIIVDSTDPATGTSLRAWHNLKVFSTGDVLSLNVGIFPVPGINFQLTELFLQLPSQAA